MPGVTHVEPEDIGARPEEFAEHFRRLGRGPEGADNPRFSHFDHDRSLESNRTPTRAQAKFFRVVRPIIVLQPRQVDTVIFSTRRY
jgi:hypothetical protein